MSTLPNFSNLSHATPSIDPVPGDVYEEWIEACGTRPTLATWKNMRAAHKLRLLHAVASRADDDTAPNGDYLSAYEQVDIGDMTSKSVEHVVPRSMIHGDEAGESDPLGWIEATRRMNSRRSNHPLYLWLEPDGQMAPYNTLVYVDGERHFVPPVEQRARIARKWLFMRATYGDTMDPPSEAQCANASKIVALARHWPIQPAEIRVNEEYREMLEWANPLLEENPEQWYGSAAWRALVFFCVPRH